MSRSNQKVMEPRLTSAWLYSGQLMILRFCTACLRSWVRHWGGQVEQEVSNLSGLFVNNAAELLIFLPYISIFRSTTLDPND